MRQSDLDLTGTPGRVQAAFLLFWPTRFVIGLPHQRAHRSLLATVPERLPAELETDPLIIRRWRRLMVLSRTPPPNPRPWGGSSRILGRPFRSPLNDIEAS